MGAQSFPSDSGGMSAIFSCSLMLVGLLGSGILSREVVPG